MEGPRFFFRCGGWGECFCSRCARGFRFCQKAQGRCTNSFRERISLWDVCVCERHCGRYLYYLSIYIYYIHLYIHIVFIENENHCADWVRLVGKAWRPWSGEVGYRLSFLGRAAWSPRVCLSRSEPNRGIGFMSGHLLFEHQRFHYFRIRGLPSA